MFTKLKQFKDLREKAKTLQSALANEKADGSAGWGKVKITFDGNQHATSVTIDPSLLSNQPALEKHIKDAINDGMANIQKILANKMKDMGGLDLAKDIQGMMGK
jgi:DNA-binding YbaB/EbfC family protein